MLNDTTDLPPPPDSSIEQEKSAESIEMAPSDQDNSGGFRLPLDAAPAEANNQPPIMPATPSKDTPALTQKDMLLLVSAGIDVWHDPEGEAYATICLKEKSTNVKVRSSEFQNFLRWQVYQAFQCAPSSQTLADVVRTLEGKAKFDGLEFQTPLRVGGDSSTTYLDLANPEGTVLMIDSAGIRSSDANALPFKFVLKPGMRSLPQPFLFTSINEALATLEDLRRYCNLKDDNEWLLFIVALLSALRPCGPFVIIVVVGEQGSAKSTLCKVFRRLVDPSVTPLRSAPKEERDLWIAASNSWVIPFDNVSRIAPDLSDSLCRLTSGGGNSYRTLYENDSETLFQAQRLVLLNTIDDLLLRGDLVDRAIQLTCHKIEDTARSPEAEFWAEFDQKDSMFLGALLFILSQTLKEIPSVKLERSPRMADFAKFGVAVEKAMNLPDGTFLQAYGANRQSLTAVTLDNQLPQLIMSLEIPLKLTPRALYQLLLDREDFTGGVPRWFPANPQQLSSNLRRLAPYLRQRGIEVEFNKSGERHIILSPGQEGGQK